MVKKGNYTQVKTVRLTKEQEDKLDDLEVSIRDTVQYYIDNNTNELRKLKNREKYLLTEIPRLETELNNFKDELREVRVKLGQNPEENQANLEVTITGDRILDNCKIQNNGKVDNITLANYMETKQANRILEAVTVEYGIKDKEKFKKNVYKYLKIYT